MTSHIKQSKVCLTVASISRGRAGRLTMFPHQAQQDCHQSGTQEPTADGSTCVHCLLESSKAITPTISRTSAEAAAVACSASQRHWPTLQRVPLPAHGAHRLGGLVTIKPQKFMGFQLSQGTRQNDPKALHKKVNASNSPQQAQHTRFTTAAHHIHYRQ